jgi:hypothetical protein
MFIGHFAPAIVAATHPKAPSLGKLFVAAQLVDYAFFVLVLTGIEKMRLGTGITAMNNMDLYHMPYTHSLLGTAGWAVLFGVFLYILSRNWVGALIGSGVVFSHWFLDLLVHAPDLTLAGNPPKLGFGLWDSPAIEMPLELGLTFGALVYFARKTKAADRKNNRVWILGVLLLALQAYNWFAPEPEILTAWMPISALAAFTLAAGVAYWAGKNRTVAVQWTN